MKEIRKSDLRQLYSAFISLCDFIEENDDIGCGNCPLWKTICGNKKGKSKGERFAEALKRIRDYAGIPEPQ